ncbi:ribonuclease inhibitor-like isoform X2 [Heterodontus francisci]|uniref:ribonuclease inhibitor-like isoform X2 n=1 Tax=Heterodontus francisci TaxID=7792 RepID=UPI00355BBE4C
MTAVEEEGGRWREVAMDRQAAGAQLLESLRGLFKARRPAAAVCQALGPLPSLDFSQESLTPSDCSVVAYILGCLEAVEKLGLDYLRCPLEELPPMAGDLHKCRSISLQNSCLGESALAIVTAAMKHPDCITRSLGLLCTGLTPRSCELLASVLRVTPSLSCLDLSENEVGDRGVGALCLALREPSCGLTTLRLKSCELSPDCCQGLGEVLCVNRTLTALDLGGNELGDAGVELLCTGLQDQRTTLQKLLLYSNKLTDRACGPLSALLKASPALRKLHLGSNNIGDAGMNKLSEALGDSGCGIQKLCVYSNSLTAGCGEDLGRALALTQSLTKLDLVCNELGDSGLRLLCPALRRPDCQLRTLWLLGNSLTTACCQELASTLSVNRSLLDLNLGYNKLGDRGVALLTAPLQQPDCQIQTLWLIENDLTAACCSDLATILRSGKLTELHLGYNDLGDSGVREIWTALSDGRCQLQSLLLMGASLTDGLRDDLTSTLCRSRTLTQLCLSENQFTDQSVDSFCRLLGSCSTLKNIALYSNMFSLEGAQRLKLMECCRPGITVEL